MLTPQWIHAPKPFSIANSIQDLEHLPDTLTAWDAFAARLIREEFEKIPGDIDHIGILIQDQHAACSNRSSQFCQLVEIQRRVDETLGNRSSHWPSEVNCFEFFLAVFLVYMIMAAQLGNFQK
jgi:hypothetical protein